MIILFHDSPNPEPFVVTDSGMFGGIFAGPNGGMGGEYRHIICLDEEKILDNYALNYECDYEQGLEALAREDVRLERSELENLWGYVTEEKDADEENQAEVASLTGMDDLGEASWEIQRLRGVVAKHFGYQAVKMKDETGISYLVLPGIKTERMLPGETTHAAEA